MRTSLLALLVIAVLAGAGAWILHPADAAGPPAERECNVTPELERSVTRGLDFLAKTQQADGSWADNYGRIPGVAGLAMMTFLAHGEVADEGKYGPVIRKSVDYIIKGQQSNGLLSGRGGSDMYGHGFATLALAEVYGHIDDPRVGPALKKAVGLIVSCQNRLGGWRYSVGATDADTTVSGAQMMALRAAANAGIEVPIDTINRGVKYYKSCFCPGGGFGYTGQDSPSSSRAGIGMLILCLSGEYRSSEVKATADWISANGQLSRDGYLYYAAYYCSQAMYQAGGSYWRQWNNTVTPALIGMQRADGAWSGEEGGGTCDTAMALLSIEINYNLLPIYQR